MIQTPPLPLSLISTATLALAHSTLVILAPQRSSNTTVKILPQAFPFAPFSAWQALPQHVSVTLKFWLNCHVLNESYSNYPI